MRALHILLALLVCPGHTLVVPLLENKQVQQLLENLQSRNADGIVSVPETNVLKGCATFLLALNPSAAFDSSGLGARSFTGRRTFSILMKARIALDPPARRGEQYELENPDTTFFSQWSQDFILLPIFEQIAEFYARSDMHPFFVEAGARDGEEHSNTLFLERNRGWTGLLIEPSNVEYPRLLKKKRKCYSWKGCLSPTGRSENVQFKDTADGLSQISQSGKDMVKAESLLSLLQEVRKKSPVRAIDFWSLDIEGSEGPVLETTDFQAIECGILMIEMNKGRENNDRIRRVMDANNFVDIGGTKYDGGVLDRVFLNPKYFEARGLPWPRALKGLTLPWKIVGDSLE